MEIIVIEDNNNINKMICKNIYKILTENNLNHKVITFTQYTNELKKIIYNNELKIYIIDIMLGLNSGYDICREIREGAFDWNSIIIISSAHNEKESIISLRLSVFTYISKLYEFEQNLEISLIQAINILEKNKMLEINKTTKVEIQNICYIEKEKNSKYCIVKTLDSEYRTRKTLKELEKTIHFKKIKNYILVNEQNIKSINKSKIVFVNSIEINIK